MSIIKTLQECILTGFQLVFGCVIGLLCFIFLVSFASFSFIVGSAYTGTISTFWFILGLITLNTSIWLIEKMIIILVRDFMLYLSKITEGEISK